MAELNTFTVECVGDNIILTVPYGVAKNIATLMDGCTDLLGNTLPEDMGLSPEEAREGDANFWRMAAALGNDGQCDDVGHYAYDYGDDEDDEDGQDRESYSDDQDRESYSDDDEGDDERDEDDDN